MSLCSMLCRLLIHRHICLLLTFHACLCLQAASAWHGVQQREQSDWCYLQLRKHLCSITAAGANSALQLDTRRALQRLQFGILTGNLGLAARQKHQVGIYSYSNTVMGTG